MSKVKLNKISVKQQGGQMIPSQPAMSNQQPVVDPMVQQVTEMISSSVNQGQDIVDVVLDLSQQQVDQQIADSVAMSKKFWKSRCCAEGTKDEAGAAGGEASSGSKEGFEIQNTSTRHLRPGKRSKGQGCLKGVGQSR